MRSLRDLTQHLTTRADDSHAAPVSEFPKAPIHLWKVLSMSRPGKFFALLRIKPHAPPLVRAPSIHLSFNLAAVLPRRSTYRVSCATMISRIPTASRHRLRRGLPGYLILFAPTLSHLSVSISPGGRLRHWCSFLYLRISPLHRKFHHPLPYSSSVVLDAVPG